MENQAKTIKMKCFRFDPDEDQDPYFETYEIPIYGAMSIQDCLIYVRENVDPSITFFINCRLGFCRRCLVRFNGKSCLACTTEVDDDFKVEPILKEKVIKDLWCEGF